MPDTLAVFEDVDVLGASGITLRCQVGGKVVVVERMHLTPGTTISAHGDGGRLVIPESAAQQLDLISRPPLATRRVLVVEDHTDVREATVALIEAWRYDVRAVADGDDGLAVALAWRPEVVCLNLELPGLSGDEIARYLVATFGGDRPVLIAIPGYGQATDRQSAIAAGFDAFCLKPFEPTVLKTCLSGALPLPPEVALPASARLLRRDGTN